MLTGILPAVLAIGIVMGAGVPSDLPDDGGGISDLVQASTDEDGHQVVVKGRSTQGASRSQGSDDTLPNTKAGSQQGADSDGVAVQHRNPDAEPAAGVPLVAVDCVAPVVACTTSPSPAPAPAAKGRVIPAVTVSDLVSFRPAVPGLSNEPDGVGVVGLPTNLLADTATQTLHGMLFDYPVAVRFTPDHYTFTYGDGNATTTRSPGRAWATSGDPQFTPTTTSHAYRERGTFTATVTVSYAPAVDFGDGVWRPVPGYVTSTSAGQRIRVYEAHTALVAHTCTENPTGPGC